MTRLIAILTLLMVVGTYDTACSSERPLRLGVLAYRPKPQTMAQWQPVADYLRATLKRPVELAAYDHKELTAAATRRAVDVVITAPSHFILLRKTAGLSSALATLVSCEEDHKLSDYGGIIFTRHDRGDIGSLADISGKRIAAASTDAFGGFQMQALEMLEAGMQLPAENRLLITGQPHDRVIEAVLAGHADAGFVRAGLIESLAKAGRLNPEQIRIINRQNFPDFPFAVSTRLYPEWPVAVMPQVDRDLAARLAAALFLLPRDSAQGHTNVIHGFTIPANYDGVENLLRRLRLPPFDSPPEISPADLWRRYSLWIVTLAGLMLLLATASTGLVVMYRRSRQSLRELERMTEKEKLLLASLAEGVYGVDTQEHCIFVNPSALAMLGFREVEILGQDAHSLFHGTWANGAPPPRGDCPVILTLRDGMKRHSEDAFVRKDGTEFPVSLTVSAMRHGRTLVGAVVVFQDITELKHAEDALKASEERFRRLAENARDAIYRMSLPDGAYEYMSPAALELFGYGPEEFYTSPGLVREIIHPEWLTYFEEEWGKLLRGEMPPCYEFPIICKSGDVRWINQRNILIRDDGGRIIAVEGIVTDVTERKRIEQEIRTLNEELEKRVKDRTAELEAKNNELAKLNKIFVGRELRMVELKERISKLESGG